MNTPTPRTDAATYPADCLGQTLVTNRDCARELERELAALTAERDQLRAIFPQICAAIGNGAFCTPTVSVGFIQSIPNEVHLVVAALRARGERAEAALAAATEECKNVRLKWHAVMGTCAAKEDAIMEADEELARLRARAERAEDNLAALEQCHDDNCRGVAKIADDLATERARLDYFLRWGVTFNSREDIDAAMQEAAK